MKAYVFPGQGSQNSGMGKAIWDEFPDSRELFKRANAIIGFSLSETMFYGSEEDLKQTRVTQPAIFVHSVIAAKMMGSVFNPGIVAGHSLGEFSALVACGALNFEDGLKLVMARAESMQKACEIEPSTMAAILGLEDEEVKRICKETKGIVVAANFNCPGQVIISGGNEAVGTACQKCLEMGAKRAIVLPVGGAFHSPYMEPARKDFEQYIDQIKLNIPICPIVQNVNALPSIDPQIIIMNLKAQLTSPVLWTQSVLKMVELGVSSFLELGPGKVLSGLVRKIDKSIQLENS